MPHTLICGDRWLLIFSTMSGSSMISFSEMTLPAACTPLSVLAQRTSEDFLGSSALALEMAPAATNAVNRSPSIVRWRVSLHDVSTSLEACSCSALTSAFPCSQCPSTPASPQPCALVSSPRHRSLPLRMRMAAPNRQPGHPPRASGAWPFRYRCGLSCLIVPGLHN